MNAITVVQLEQERAAAAMRDEITKRKYLEEIERRTIYLEDLKQQQAKEKVEMQKAVAQLVSAACSKLNPSLRYLNHLFRGFQRWRRILCLRSAATT